MSTKEVNLQNLQRQNLDKNKSHLTLLLTLASISQLLLAQIYSERDTYMDICGHNGRVAVLFSLVSVVHLRRPIRWLVILKWTSIILALTVTVNPPSVMHCARMCFAGHELNFSFVIKNACYFLFQKFYNLPLKQVRINSALF